MLQYPIYGAKDKFSKQNRERQRGMQTNLNKASRLAQTIVAQ